MAHTIGDRAEAILDAAEVRARRQGYFGFSFRDLASDIGIKSSSVHYHFQSKEALADALATRYTDRFLDHLGDPASPEFDTTAKLQRYIDAYRHSISEDHSMCLCGMFGAEIDALPDTVKAEVRRFFDLNTDWLVAALSGGSLRAGDTDLLRERATLILAALEGGLLLSRAHDDIGLFDRVARQVLASQSIAV
jgi:TetR/AcrR family transcriptional repressor of nem operon